MITEKDEFYAWKTFKSQGILSSRYNGHPILSAIDTLYFTKKKKKLAKFGLLSWRSSFLYVEELTFDQRACS